MIVLALALQAAAPPPCPPGIHVERADSWLPLVETRADHRKVAGLAGAMLLGPFGGGRMKVKSVVAGARASVRVAPGRPIFRFCFAPPPAATGDYVGVDAPATNPADYRLIRFEAGKDQRELALSVVGGFGGPRGTFSQSVLPYTTEEIAPGMYRIAPAADLMAGEYGFMQAPRAATSSRSKDATERVFDFGVD